MQLDYSSLLANISDGLYFTDPERRITFWNHAAERISGYSAGEVLGRRCADDILVHVDENGNKMCNLHCPLEAVIERASPPPEAKIFLHHKEGHRLPVRVRVVPLKDALGQIIGAAEFFTDISNQEIMSERIRELEQMALLDPLTRLPNRHHLEPSLISRLNERDRFGLHFGLLFLDLDHFKRINDLHGHDVGDRVLQTVANTLKVSVRPFDTVGRWGGEEFVCIVRSAGEAVLRSVAQRLLVAIGTSTVQTADRIINISVSIGATMVTERDSLETLVKRADQLMYASKQRGRSRITYG